ncbi:polysaccharide biosynthesis C-terminal domain-containing protein [soil metagenome]
MKIRVALTAWYQDRPSLIAIANILAAGLALLTAPIVARAIGPEGRGETAAAIAAFAIVPIFLALGVPLEIRRLAATNDESGAVRTARRLWVVALVPSIAAALVLDYLVFDSLTLPGRMLAGLGIALAPVSMAWMTDLNVLVARANYRGVFATRLAQPVVYLILVSCAWVLDIANVPTILAAGIMGNVFTAILSTVLVKISFRGPRSEYRPLLKRGASFAGSTAAEAASYRLDQLLVLPLIGAQQAGYYSIATTIGALPLAVGHALGATYFRDVAKANSRARKALMRGAVRASIAAAFATCLFFLATIPFAIPLVFGSAFAGAVQPAMISMTGSFFLVVSFVCSMTLAADSRGRQMTIAQTVCLAAGMLLLYLLAPPWEASGAAIASAISYSLLLTLLLFSIRIAPSRLVPRKKDFAEAWKRILG